MRMAYFTIASEVALTLAVSLAASPARISLPLPFLIPTACLEALSRFRGSRGRAHGVDQFNEGVRRLARCCVWRGRMNSSRSLVRYFQSTADTFPVPATPAHLFTVSQSRSREGRDAPSKL